MFLNNNWYAIDATWDDPIIIGNGTIDNKIKYKYFLKGANEFFKNHTEDGKLTSNGIEFSYPELSDENYRNK